MRWQSLRGRWSWVPLERRGVLHRPNIIFTQRCYASRSAKQLINTGSGVSFDSFDLHPHTLRGLNEAFRFKEATQVQAQVLPQVLAPDARGSDFVIHARAGTGKTLAYLIPAIEHVIKNPPPGIGVLIIAPSRELVLQITKDAETLCSYHALQIVPLIGGIRRDKDEAAIRRRRPAILVGTVSKLVEHFEGTRRFETLFDALSILVLDECDRLLQDTLQETSFASLENFLKFLPRKTERQTLLLSATVPDEVRHLCTALCRSNCHWIDLVQGLPTQEAVQQFFAYAPPLLLCTALRNVLDQQIQEKPTSYKIIVFFPTARLAAFATTLFQEQLQMRIHQIHSRCAPSARMLTQEEFTKAMAGILFTSAASERGMDYPDVTLVVQVMAPGSRQQYIHRVGRTARGGKEGQSLLLLLEMEDSFMSQIEDIPVMRSPGSAKLLNDEGLYTADALSSAKWASRSSLTTLAAAAFASLLQHLKSNHPQLENQDVVDVASELLMGFGVSEPPLVSSEFAKELGLETCENLALVEQRDDKARPIRPAPVDVAYPMTAGGGAAKFTIVVFHEEQKLQEALEEILTQSREKLQSKRKRLEEIQNEQVKLARSSADQEKVAPGEEAKPSAIIKLNVGGDTSFVTRRDTLTAIEGSRLSQLFSGRWDKVLPKDRDGRIFLDLDPVQFRALLSWLVDTKRMAPGSGQGPPLKAVPLEYQAGFLELCELLCSNNEGKSRSGRDDDVMFTSQILSSEDQQRLKTWIQHESCPSKHCTGNLLFRATRDGFTGAAFHQKCDGKGPTVVIAKSAGGHIFGGYTESAWDSSNQYKNCRDSFLFRLSGPGGVGPSQHRIFQNFQHGIYCHSGYGPIFGGGADMEFENHPQVSFPSFGHSYTSNGRSFLAEAQDVTITEYEVFEFVQRVTYESVKKSLAGELKKCKDHLNGDQYELLSKALEASQGMVEYCSDFSKQEKSLADQCKAADGEVQFMKRFLGRCHSDQCDDSIVKLNVSGVAMETFRSTLLWQEGSTLAAKFGSAWTVQSEEMVDGGVFFDEDPSLFTLLLLHLRLGSMLGESFVPRVPDEKLGAWQRFIKYLNLDDALTPDDMKLDSLILAGLTDELKQLSEWLPKKKTTLLFRATRDGFTGAAFHQKCDGKGPTVVIVKSAGGHIFGGYTETAWDSSNQYKNCRDSFLFRLSGPGEGPSQHRIFQSFQYGIYCHSGYGPAFGGGHDMYFTSNSQVVFSVGHTYNQNGTGGNRKSLAESSTVSITEYEVFSLKD